MVFTHLPLKTTFDGSPKQAKIYNVSKRMKNVDNIALPQRGSQVKMGLQFAGVLFKFFW